MQLNKGYNNLNIIYAKEYGRRILTKPTLFLAGPTPRSDDVPSWRPEFISILEETGFDGNVCVPEDRDGKFKGSYTDQVEWEHAFLGAADAIVFWVPRNLETMPAFTTNVEFGYYIKSGRVIYGRPLAAPKNKYLDWLYEKETGRGPINSIEALARDTLCLIEWNPKKDGQ